jgi:hypothetical protein
VSARHRLFGGLVLCAIALLLVIAAPADALHAWLAAAFLWSGLPFGSLGLLMVMRVTAGRWDQALPVYLEAGALTLPIAFLALLPPLFGMRLLYPWMTEVLTGFKGWWLAPLPFLGRTILLFLGASLVLWTLVARRGPALAIASAGLLFMLPMLTFVLTDWIVSLDLEFHSSGFGLYAMAIQFTVALMAAIWLLLGRQPWQTAALAPIMITLILIWIYLAFTHYIIVWSGNLASVVGWYAVRENSGWAAAYTFTAVTEAAGFLALIFPGPRHSAAWLRAIAAMVVLGKLLEAAWLVLPEAGAMRPGAIALYLLTAIALGLVFLSTQELLLDWRVAARVPA